MCLDMCYSDVSELFSRISLIVPVFAQKLCYVCLYMCFANVSKYLLIEKVPRVHKYGFRYSLELCVRVRISRVAKQRVKYVPWSTTRVNI